MVGDDFWANLKWGRVVKWWMMKGYNQSNYQGMLDVFVKGRSDQGSKPKSGFEMIMEELDNGRSG